MTVTVRLDHKLEQELATYSVVTGKSKSQIIKESLAAYLAKAEKPKTSYELGKDLFGREGSGDGDRSTRHREYVKEIVRAKHARRRRSPDGTV